MKKANYPLLEYLANAPAGNDEAFLKIPLQTHPGSVCISQRRFQFVGKCLEANAQGFAVDIDKIHMDGYNSAEALPVIHRQHAAIQAHRPLPPTIHIKTFCLTASISSTVGSV